MQIGEEEFIHEIVVPEPEPQHVPEPTRELEEVPDEELVPA